MKKGLTELVFILDKSGSMGGLESDTIGGYNSMLANQQAVEGECQITTVLFDNNHELLHDRIDIKAISPITEKEYQVGGSTALLDAIGRTIHKIGNVQKHTADDYRAEKVMFVIITDGEENSSHEYTSDKVKAQIERQKSRYGWEFIFLGANIDAVETAARFGIDRGRAQNYHADSIGSSVVYGAMAQASVAFRKRGAMPEDWNAPIQADYKRRGGSSGLQKARGTEIMLGAIIGDIVGSVYEWHNIKTKNFPLFRDDCFFTDDTVMTIATADALMNGGKPDDFIDAYKKWGRLYPNAGYGNRFSSWIHSEERGPYNSWGNGSAMRVSPCGWAVPLALFMHESIDCPQELAEVSASVTHDHPEGIKGARAVACAIYLLRNGKARGVEGCYREKIADYVSYDLSRSLDEIRPTYRFNASCQDTVPQAIIAFLESTDFEDAIRNAISIGGDSDTLAAITGSIAEAAYGIPQWINVAFRLIINCPGE